jgi:hypothetical protein
LLPLYDGRDPPLRPFADASSAQLNKKSAPQNTAAVDIKSRDMPASKVSFSLQNHSPAMAVLATNPFGVRDILRRVEAVAVAHYQCGNCFTTKSPRVSPIQPETQASQLFEDTHVASKAGASESVTVSPPLADNTVL